MNKSHMARKRAEIIMKVNCGLMTAAQAARELNVSRKTYYKWEKKGLSALLGCVTDQEAGRPERQRNTDQEILEATLDQTIKENRILQHRITLKDVVSDLKPGSGSRAKKNRAAVRIVREIEGLKERVSLSIKKVVKFAGLSYSNFYRWKRRIAKGESPIGKPGPKKITSFDLEYLKAEIDLLEHCRKRTHRTGLLHKKYGAGISRRELNALIKEARATVNGGLNADMYCLQWHYADLAWALDGCEMKTDHFKVFIQNVQDLYSTYKLNPLITLDEPCGNKIAIFLHDLFRDIGPPLFFKRDNARNYNNRHVDDLLKEAFVIPINSPVYYARYNGSIEHAQGENKACLRNKRYSAKTADEAVILTELGVHELNHKSRRRLKGQNACQTYFSGKRLRYNKRKRKEVFEWIWDLAFDISVKIGMNQIDPTAWRIACRQWMEKNRMLTIRRRGNVLPNFSIDFCHN